MSEPTPRPDEKILTSLLLAVVILAAVALMKEGPQYDNVLESWRFFNTAFFTGALVGFLGWTQTFRIVPTLSLKPADRQPWIAAFALGLVFTVGGVWLNRSYTTPTGRVLVAEIDTLKEIKDDRWQLSVKHSDGSYQRYQITKDAAAALKSRNSVRMEVGRGALGFDLITRFEPNA
jgi:hypothetical protein